MFPRTFLLIGIRAAHHHSEGCGVFLGGDFDTLASPNGETVGRGARLGTMEMGRQRQAASPIRVGLGMYWMGLLSDDRVLGGGGCRLDSWGSPPRHLHPHLSGCRSWVSPLESAVLRWVTTSWSPWCTWPGECCPASPHPGSSGQPLADSCGRGGPAEEAPEKAQGSEPGEGVRTLEESPDSSSTSPVSDPTSRKSPLPSLRLCALPSFQ